MPFLKIENFKCYKKGNVEFKDLTVLVGANGAGKSSIIQSILLLREAIFSYTGHKLPLNDFRGQKLGQGVDIVYNNDTSKNIKLSWNVDSPMKTSRVTLGIPYSDAMLDMDIVRKTIGKNDLTNPEFHFLSADRLGSTIAQPIKSSDYPEVGEKGQYCAQLLADKFTYKVQSNRLYAPRTSPYLIDQTNLYLKDIFPGVEIDAHVANEMQTAQVLIRNSVKKSFGVSTNVGFGISYLLPIIVTGLIANSGTLIIVENPEAHLHPAAQSQVGKFLAKIAATGTRVIVETHSDHLINGMQYYAVANPDFLSKIIINNFSITDKIGTNQGKIKVVPITLSANGDYTFWPDGFMDQSRKDLYELYKIRMKTQNQ